MMARFGPTLCAVTCIALNACTSDRLLAPRLVSIAGATVRVDASLWRDFQPIAPPDGQPLVGIFAVRTIDDTPIPPGVTADSAWVYNGVLAWATAVVEEHPRGEGASFFEVVARNGPKWAPGIEVDVVLQLHDATGQRVLIQAPRQRISRSD